MQKYIEELALFKQRQEQFQTTAARGLADFRQLSIDRPVQAAYSAPNMIDFVAMHEVARQILYQIATFDCNPGDWNPGNLPKQQWETLWRMCNSEFLIRADTPQSLPLGQKLYYDAQRSRYAKEVTYLRDRRNIMESQQ
jgi:hypothetical protein